MFDFADFFLKLCLVRKNRGKVQAGPREQVPMCLYAVCEAQGEVQVARGSRVSVQV